MKRVKLPRGILLVILTCLVTLNAAATGGRQTSGTAAGGPTRFRYYRDVFNGVAVQGWGNMVWMQEWQRRMNVEITFLGPGSGEAFASAINIMLASGDYPEVIYNNWNNYTGGLAAAIEDGIAINLGRDYRAKLPNWFGILAGNDAIRRAVTLDDGTSALLCHIEYDLRRSAYEGYGIRKDWLDKLGMRVPTTITELEAFCEAVLRTDLNGNGRNDEIPLAEANSLGLVARLAAAWGIRRQAPTIDPYNPGKITWWTQVQNGQPFMDFTRTMASWYQRGYFDRDGPTLQDAARVANITSGIVGMFDMRVSQSGTWADVLKQTVPDAEIYGMVPLIGPAGKPYTTNNAHIRYAASNEGTIITPTAVRNGSVDAILAFLDYGYSDAGRDLINWGIEGLSYTLDANGKHQWTDLVTNDPQYRFNDIVTKYAIPSRGGWPKIMDYDAWIISDAGTPVALAAHENYWKGDIGLLVPPILLSRTEAEEYNRIMTDVITMIDENFMRFFVGTRNINELPAFMNQLSGMRIDRAMEYYQAAYDRYMRK